MTVWHIILVWTVSWKLQLSCRHVTINGEKKKRKKIDYFQTGYLVKALISQSFIYKTLPPLTGLYMHKWMWHLRQRECHERFWTPVSPFLSNETTTFLNISRKWKPPNAIHCWCTKRQKTEREKKRSVYHHLSQRPFSKLLSPLGQPCCFNSITPRESHKAELFLFVCDNQPLKTSVHLFCWSAHTI